MYVCVHMCVWVGLGCGGVVREEWRGMCGCGRGSAYVHVFKCVTVWVHIHAQILKTENFQITCKLFKEITY